MPVGPVWRVSPWARLCMALLCLWWWWCDVLSILLYLNSSISSGSLFLRKSRGCPSCLGSTLHIHVSEGDSDVNLPQSIPNSPCHTCRVFKCSGCWGGDGGRGCGQHVAMPGQCREITWLGLCLPALHTGGNWGGLCPSFPNPALPPCPTLTWRNRDLAIPRWLTLCPYALSLP